MTVEDRLRSTTQAVTAAMRPLRPFDLSDAAPAPVNDTGSLELPEELRSRDRHSHARRRWLNWGAPIAAAALVTALALVLVMLRQAPAPPSGSAPAVSSPGIPASLPRYYVALAAANPRSAAPLEAVVGDDRTGRRVAVISPLSGQNFTGVTGAADDRTFVLSSYLPAQKETVWYLLRLTPGAAHPAALTKLPMKPLPREVTGLAVSPDGGELAVMYRTANVASKASTGLLTYSLSSGAELGAWRTAVRNGDFPGGANVEGLSWVNGDRSVAFRWWALEPAVSNTGVTQVRSLDVAAAGHDLLADSHVVLQVPFTVDQDSAVSAACGTSLAASDGRTVVCGSNAVGVSPSGACPDAPPSFVSYPAATGKPLQVLYRYQGSCSDGQALLLWTDSSGSHAIGLVLVVKGKQLLPASFGVVAAGHLTPLPALVVGPVSVQSAPDEPGGIAF